MVRSSAGGLSRQRRTECDRDDWVHMLTWQRCGHCRADTVPYMPVVPFANVAAQAAAETFISSPGMVLYPAFTAATTLLPHHRLLRISFTLCMQILLSRRSCPLRCGLRAAAPRAAITTRTVATALCSPSAAARIVASPTTRVWRSSVWRSVRSAFGIAVAA